MKFFKIIKNFWDTKPDVILGSPHIKMDDEYNPNSQEIEIKTRDKRWEAFTNKELEEH